MTSGPLTSGIATARREGRRGSARKLLSSPLGALSISIIVIVTAASVLAPLLAAGSPSATSLSDVLAPPSAAHPLGADGVGRDVLARLLHGGQTSLAAGAITVTVAVLIGVPMGVTAGYYGGRFDAVARWISDALVALPAIIVLLVVMAVVGSNMVLAMSVFGVMVAPGFFRLTRAATMRIRGELYVDAARVSGLSDARIMTRHIIRIVRAPIIIQTAMMFGVGISIQAGLAFLGLGDANEASWGAMLDDAFTNIYAAPDLLIAPGVAIGVTVGAFALLGNALRDALEDEDALGDDAPGDDPTGDSGPARDRATAMTTGDPVLDVRDLDVQYPMRVGHRTVVRGVSFSVARGEALGIVGESGSGKSQTAFAVLGLLPREARARWQTMTIAGVKVGDGVSKRAQVAGHSIAYVPQEPMSNLDPTFRIGTQLSEPLRRHRRLGRASAWREAVRLLDRVGIPDPASVALLYPHQISGGMAQRVLIAIAISCDPDVLIADEPTTALDVTVQAEVLDLLRQLQAENGMAIVIVTHDFGVVADMCDRVAVMRHGDLIEHGATIDIFDAPRHPYTRSLLDAGLDGKRPFSRLSEGSNQ